MFTATLAFAWKAYTAYRTINALMNWRTASPLTKAWIIFRLITLSPLLN